MSSDYDNGDFIFIMSCIWIVRMSNSDSSVNHPVILYNWLVHAYRNWLHQKKLEENPVEDDS